MEPPKPMDSGVLRDRWGRLAQRDDNSPIFLTKHFAVGGRRGPTIYNARDDGSPLEVAHKKSG